MTLHRLMPRTSLTLFFIILLLPLRVLAQGEAQADSVKACAADTLALSPDTLEAISQTLSGHLQDPQNIAPATSEHTSFRPKDIILPAGLIAIGSAGLIDGVGRRLDGIDKKRTREWRKWNSLRWDNVIQYSPTLLGIGLNVCGVRSKYTRQERLMMRLTSWAVMGAAAYSLKAVVKETRPNGADDNAFPSGHTATAFQGAELVRQEYGGWYGVAAYAMAIGVGVQRFMYDQHWVHDVIAGAGIGILAARTAVWLLPLERKLLGMDKHKKRQALALVPYYDTSGKAVGGSFAMSF